MWPDFPLPTDKFFYFFLLVYIQTSTSKTPIKAVANYPKSLFSFHGKKLVGTLFVHVQFLNWIVLNAVNKNEY